MTYSAADGILAEVQAGEYLEKKGYRILDRNIAYKGAGELDIVCEDKKTIVVVEVRYRKDGEYGSPLESITKPKMRRIIRTAERYLAERKLYDRPVRFDVVCVTDRGCEHVVNAFYGDFY
jgi:putative endonuclease